MKYILSFIICILFTSQLLAQNFKGRIIDKTATPLYGSSVFIKEIKQGLICNEDGYYQTTLAPGNYSVEYKHRCFYIFPQSKISGLGYSFIIGLGYC